MHTMFGDDFFSDLFGDFGFGNDRRHQQRRALMNQGAAQQQQFEQLNNGQQMNLFSPNEMFFNPERMFRSIDDLMRQTQTRMSDFHSQGDEQSALSRRDGGGIFHSQVMMMSSTMGPNGEVQTRRYAQSDRGDLSRGVREVREAYEEPEEQRAMHYRQLGGRAHRIHKRRDPKSGHVDTMDQVHGFDRTQLGAFGADWTSQAVPHLPPAPRQQQAAVASGRLPALPAAVPTSVEVNTQPYAGQRTPYVQEEATSSRLPTTITPPPQQRVYPYQPTSYHQPPCHPPRQQQQQPPPRRS